MEMPTISVEDAKKQITDALAFVTSIPTIEGELNASLEKVRTGILELLTILDTAENPIMTAFPLLQLVETVENAAASFGKK